MRSRSGTNRSQPQETQRLGCPRYGHVDGTGVTSDRLVTDLDKSSCHQRNGQPRSQGLYQVPVGTKSVLQGIRRS